MKKIKKIWVIREDQEGFALFDDLGTKIISVPNKYQRQRLFDAATDRGADEVLHDYDLVKVDGSGT